MLFPDDGWLERPWPRRSWATTRKPCRARNSIWPSHASAFSGHPWERVTAGPSPQLIDLGAVFGRDGAHWSTPCDSCVTISTVASARRRSPPWNTPVGYARAGDAGPGQQNRRYGRKGTERPTSGTRDRDAVRPRVADSGVPRTRPGSRRRDRGVMTMYLPNNYLRPTGSEVAEFIDAHSWPTTAGPVPVAPARMVLPARRLRRR